MHSAEFIIRLNHNNRTVFLSGISGDNGANSVKIRTDFLNKFLMQIRYRRIMHNSAMPISGQNFRILHTQPWRQSIINKFRILIRSRSYDHRQIHFSSAIQKVPQVELWGIKIELAFRRFVNQPWNVCADGISSHFLKQLHPFFPLCMWNTEIVELAGIHIKWFSVEFKKAVRKIKLHIKNFLSFSIACPT